MTVSARQPLRIGQNWSGGLPVGPEVVKTPFDRGGSGRVALQQGRKWSVDPQLRPEVVE